MDGFHAEALSRSRGTARSHRPLCCSRRRSPRAWAQAPNLYPLTADFPLGAYHGAETVYLIRTAPALNPAQRRLSDRMLSYWTRFASTGNPNGERTPRWHALRPAHPTVLTLDTTDITNRYGFDTRHHCGFWNSFTPDP